MGCVCRQAYVKKVAKDSSFGLSKIFTNRTVLEQCHIRWKLNL